MSGKSDDKPVRSHMDDPSIVWRGTKPQFDTVDDTYMKGRTRNHKPGSLEKILENAMKTFEMEASHKVKPEDYGSIDPDKFRLRSNGGREFTVKDVIEKGTYNIFMDDNVLFNAKAETFDSAMAKFKTCFPDGYAWELLDVQSGPPVCAFTWRHWGRFAGPYNGHEPTGEIIEMFGSAVAKVDEKLRIVDVDLYFDTNPTLAKLNHVKCPFIQ